MSDETTAGTSPGLSGLLIGIAALIAASALLIFALAYAGFLGRGDATEVAETVPAEDVQPAEGESDAGEADEGDAADGQDEDQGQDENGDGSGDGSDDGNGADEADADGGADTDDEAGDEEQAGMPAGGGEGAYPGGGAGAGGGVMVIVDDFSAYPDMSTVDDLFDVNQGEDANAIDLALLDAAASPSGPAGLRLDWAIAEESVSDFVGTDRYLDAPQDWSGARRLAIMADPSERDEKHFVLQFREAGSGEVWRHQGLMSDIPDDGRPYSVPLDEEHFQLVGWAGRDDEAMQIEAVDYYAVYLGHAGPGEGALRIGTIWVDDREE